MGIKTFFCYFIFNKRGYSSTRKSWSFCLTKILQINNGCVCLLQLIRCSKVHSCRDKKMAWYLLFYLRGVRLLMLALKASTVEACGIRGGKLFHVVIVLGKELYSEVSMLVWYGWKRRECVREVLNFGCPQHNK